MLAIRNVSTFTGYVNFQRQNLKKSHENFWRSAFFGDVARNLTHSKYILSFKDLNLNSGLSSQMFHRNVPVGSGVGFISPYVECTASSSGHSGRHSSALLTMPYTS